MNREELLALVAEYEQKDKPYITLPREDVKELLSHYRPLPIETVTLAVDKEVYIFPMGNP